MGKVRLLLVFGMILSGCGTTTQRLATEQLLISDAVDQAVEQIDFNYLRDQDIYLETRYLTAIVGTGYANPDYIISSIREQLTAAGCRIHENRDDARIIVEPRVGALGTDGHEVTYGIPQTSQITTAAAALHSAPIVPAIPEIAFGKSDKQTGVAKLRIFAYDKETKMVVWQSGLKKSESTSNNTWVMGAGPFQKGSIHDKFRFAGNDIRHGIQPHDPIEAADSNPTILASLEMPDDEDSTDEMEADEETVEEAVKGSVDDIDSVTHNESNSAEKTSGDK
jgi:hypothetical protein